MQQPYNFEQSASLRSLPRHATHRNGCASESRGWAEANPAGTVAVRTFPLVALAMLGMAAVIFATMTRQSARADGGVDD